MPRSRMKTHDSFPAGTHVEAGTYVCVSCGYVLKLEQAGELPNCPKDEGLHAILAWQPEEPSDGREASDDQRPSKPR